MSIFSGGLFADKNEVLKQILELSNLASLSKTEILLGNFPIGAD